MRKSFLFLALLAGIAMMTGCQKEKDGITLKAVIDQETKAYIGTITSGDNVSYYPFWESDDPVKINSGSYSITPSNENGSNYGTISGVDFSAPYCAFFPADIVTSETISVNSSSNSGTASIYLNTHQKYSEVYTDGPQKLDMPMAAFTSNGTTLFFKNLCSVIRVEVKTNSTIDQFDVRSISVTAKDANNTDVPIAGYYTATISSNSTNPVTLTPQNNATNGTVTLHKTDYSSMGTVSPDVPKTFYIIVPAFSSNSVSITVETEDGRFFTKTAPNANIARSTIAPITLDAAEAPDIFTGDVAYLESGADFLRDITTNFSGFNSIVFDKHYLSSDPTASYSPCVEVQSANAPTPVVKIWAYQSGTTIKIVTRANTIYANPNCQGMFQNLTSVSSIQAYGVHFNTSLVTNMSYMFAGCSSLGSAFTEFPHFNTSNVTTMAHMFDGCSNLGLGGLSLRTFDTQHLDADGMVAMFKGCSSMRSLDLSSFTTSQITNMTELFYGCEHMQNLDIRHFTIGEGVTKTRMCLGLSTIGSDNPCIITCTGGTDGVSSALLEQCSGTAPSDPYATTDLNPGDPGYFAGYTYTTVGENGYYCTGIIPNNINWHIVPAQQ